MNGEKEITPGVEAADAAEKARLAANMLTAEEASTLPSRFRGLLRALREIADDSTPADIAAMRKIVAAAAEGGHYSRDSFGNSTLTTVSYTHLTLPTNSRV